MEIYIHTHTGPNISTKGQFLYFLNVVLYFLYIVTCVRFPWQLDIGALSCNNGIVQHCWVSLDMQQYWTALASLADNNVNKQHCYARNKRQVFPRSQDCCIRNSTDMNSVCVGIRSSADMCVFGYALLLVGRLSLYREIAREAREFIPWMVNTFDLRG
jgi:hypothetical protein